ncbi:MAG TPA: hypothetical protein PLK30_22015 [Blastocatellia bacterium]|nr:hypothetical protein [Blastocatellia bacterium]
MMFVFLMSKLGIAVVVLALIVYVALITMFMTWYSKRLNDATAKFENWLPQWVSQNGWQLIEYHSSPPNKLIGLIHKNKLYLWFVIRDQHKKEHKGLASYNLGLLSSGQINVLWETSEPPQQANRNEAGATPDIDRI